jgi:NAD-dependent SIR2 family protein deacetylase
MSTASLIELLRGRRAVALTGAGMSTDSGIPDYRGESSRARTRTPIQHRDFLRDAAVRTRYWARSFVGWPRIAGARPNAAHLALADLERRGAVTGVITQNVDRLHQAAGSERVLELHGALARTRCLACGTLEARDELQDRMRTLNAGLDLAGAAAAPDGDAELASELVAGFHVPACRACGGTLKPDVVFFGDNVARPLVDEAFGMVESAEALLVLGTSLTVFSGYRFVRRAAERGIPIAIVNRGETRGDALAAVLVDGRLGDVLTELSLQLSPAPAASV